MSTLFINQIKMTKVEIINIVASHYNESNRAYEKGFGCKYRTEDGRMCAVGMCMTDEGLREFGDTKSAVHAIANMLQDRGKELDDILKDEYRGHDIELWEKLQVLHDNETHWNEDGISNLGKHKVSRLINELK